MTIRAVAVLGVALSLATPSAGQGDPMPGLTPTATVTEIAEAVHDCVAQDGQAGSLVRAGWTEQKPPVPMGEMAVYRRQTRGPVLVLPRTANPLRCWIMAAPAGDRASVMKAIGDRLGPDAVAGPSGWRIGQHALSFDWSAEPGKAAFTRIEVYMLPQEKK